MKINPNVLRKKVIDMVRAKQSGHIGGCFSMAELTSVLYEEYEMGGRDKLILSKGHAVPIIYAALHEMGEITDEELDLFREIDSPLQGHPDKERLPILDATTGSLGQGLSIAIGHSLGKKLKDEEKKIISQKNALSKEEYKKKADALRKKVFELNKGRDNLIREVAAKRKKAGDEMLKKLNPILGKYMEENNISVVIDKKNVLMGDKKFEITSQIIEILNKEFKSINLN